MCGYARELQRSQSVRFVACNISDKCAATWRQWVFELANELPTLAQLERVPPEERTPEQEKRIERLKRRAHIKEKNASVL